MGAGLEGDEVIVSFWKQPCHHPLWSSVLVLVAWRGCSVSIGLGLKPSKAKVLSLV